ncbi:MAG: 4Fe-4S binding protein [Phycisphaerales bacterium JB050]
MPHSPTFHPNSDTGASISLPVLDQGKPKKPYSQMGKWRAGVLIALHLFMAARIVQWKITGSTISPIEPSESMQTLEVGLVNAGFVFFLAAILLTLVFGRFVCGWACHVVAMQDFCGWLMKKCGVHPTPFRSRLLVFVPLGLALYMFVWPSFKRIALVPLLDRVAPAVVDVIGRPAPFPIDGFRTEFVVDDFWATFPGLFIAIPFLLIIGFASVYFLGAKGFCTYGCPYGGFFYPADRFSVARIVVDDEKCDSNGHCTAVCTSNVRVHEEIKDYGSVVDPGCMKCMDCVSACPTNALALKFAKPQILNRKPRRRHKPRSYDLSWPEEIGLGAVFLVTLLATRGLYAVVPLLMAVGIAGIVTFLAYKAWRTLRVENVRFHRFQLRLRGHTTGTGWAWLTLTGIVLILVGHSLAVNQYRWRADQAFRGLELSKAALFAPSPPRFDESQTERMQRALDLYRQAAPFSDGGIGLAPNAESMLRMALLHLALGQHDDAIVLLERVERIAGGADELTADREQVRILSGLAVARLAQGRPGVTRDEIEQAFASAREQTERAIENMRQALAEHPEWWATRERLIDTLNQTGRPDQGIAAADEGLAALSDKPKFARARGRALLDKARALRAAGNPEAAFEAMKQAAEVSPRDAVIRENLAAAYAQYKQDPDSAIRELLTAIQLQRSSPDRYERLAALLIAVDRKEEALDAFSEALKRVQDKGAFAERIEQNLIRSDMPDLAEQWRERQAEWLGD